MRRNKNKKSDDNIVQVDILDALLDENNNAPIYMSNDRGEQLGFEQIAVIPYGEDELYAILKPIDKIPGIKEDEAVVFKVDVDENEKGYLTVEINRTVAEAVFDQYYKLVQEAGMGVNNPTSRQEE